MDRNSKSLAIQAGFRYKSSVVELVTTLHKTDGTTQEITHLRQAVCKKTMRRGNKTILEFADIDRSALDRVFPFETFTVADFPELFVDHVGRRIPQGVGTVQKVPLTWVKKTGGVWRYAGPKVVGGVGFILAVYRGAQHGQGAVVSATEYGGGAIVGAATGVTVHAVDFTREQLDDKGRPYALDADFFLPGSRVPSDEISRILTAFGITPDAATFAAAAAADAGTFLVDPLYGNGTNGRTGNAIIEDLLRVARGWLSPTPTGAWAIIQDIAKAATQEFDTSADQVRLEEYGDGDVPSKVSGAYRPKTSGAEDFTGLLSRKTAGIGAELQLKFPYVRDHAVMDRLLSYWKKRLNSLKLAKGVFHATQIPNGEVISVTDTVAYSGTKSFIATGISRPADANAATLREYDAAIYPYSAPGPDDTQLPADASNLYGPDYSFTPPLAPTGLAVVALTATIGPTDGKISAQALVRAVPPAANWARLMVQLEDVATKEQFNQQLFLAAGNYEATIPNLKNNTLYAVRAFAVNANSVEGAIATIANITTTNYANVPLAPTGLTVVSQGTNADTDGKLRAYALVRAVPPVANFARLFARLTDTTTNEQHTQELFLVGGNYEGTFEGLRPSRLHSIVTYAENLSNVPGATATIANFNTANYTTSPAAPTTISVQQQSPRQTLLQWGNVANVAGQPDILQYIVFKQTGAGAFTELLRLKATIWIDDNISLAGTTYSYKVRAEDMNHNESTDSGTVSITPSKVINDGYIVGQGVGTGSIADGAVNRVKAGTSTGNATATLAGGGGTGSIQFDYYTFFPQFTGSVGAYPVLLLCVNAAVSDDRGLVNFRGDGAVGGTANCKWRYIIP